MREELALAHTEADEAITDGVTLTISVAIFYCHR
jgi:hypothetical protein